jgi:hypothetical protein
MVKPQNIMDKDWFLLISRTLVKLHTSYVLRRYTQNATRIILWLLKARLAKPRRVGQKIFLHCAAEPSLLGCRILF